MPIIGALRIKNEARWIDRVVRSIQPLCERIVIFDDHSTDGTPEICEALGCEVHRSAFDGLDEKRDKNYMLDKVFKHVPHPHYLGDKESPYWCLAIDGDEELHPDDAAAIRLAVGNGTRHHVFSLQVLYLWDRPDQVRFDGVYREFFRPSLFRLMNSGFRYQSTPWGNGANFHCSNIPQEFLGQARRISARLLHYGYMNRHDRLRKFEWYNRVDPGNNAEDQYKHMVMGDLPEIPANSRRKWAGPLMVKKIECARVA